MLALILFIICTGASAIGSLVGAGGGVIIKPLLDMLSLMPVKTASFCSGCTVLCMALVSLFCNHKSGVKLQIRISTFLALGSVAGGFVGSRLLDTLAKGLGSHTLGGIQALVLTFITIGVLFYVCRKNRLRSFHVQKLYLCVLIGFILGMLSAFLGIGGGPINLAVLFLFFSMDAKEAAKNSIYIIVFSQLASLCTTLISRSVPVFRWPDLFCMICGGICGAMIGAAIGRKLNAAGVEKALKLLIIVIILINIYNTFNFFFFSHL